MTQPVVERLRDGLQVFPPNDDTERTVDRIRHLLAGQPVYPEDLDLPFVELVAGTSRSRQDVADTATEPRPRPSAPQLPRTRPTAPESI